MGPEGAPPGPAQAPTMPGSLSSGPPGPGSSPVTSPGGGEGQKAAAAAAVKAMLEYLPKMLAGFEIGSPEYKALVQCLSILSKTFGGGNNGQLVPSAIMGMVAGAKKPGPGAGMPSAPPPGVAGPGGV